MPKIEDKVVDYLEKNEIEHTITKHGIEFKGEIFHYCFTVDSGFVKPKLHFKFIKPENIVRMPHAYNGDLEGKVGYMMLCSDTLNPNWVHYPEAVLDKWIKQIREWYFNEDIRKDEIDTEEVRIMHDKFMFIHRVHPETVGLYYNFGNGETHVLDVTDPIMFSKSKRNKEFKKYSDILSNSNRKKVIKMNHNVNSIDEISLCTGINKLGIHNVKFISGNITKKVTIGNFGSVKKRIYALDFSEDNIRSRQGGVRMDNTIFTVIGCGTLGSFAIDALARMGAKNFNIYDPEPLEPENFSRHWVRPGTFKEELKTGKIGKVNLLKKQLISDYLLDKKDINDHLEFFTTAKDLKSDIFIIAIDGMMETNQIVSEIKLKNKDAKIFSITTGYNGSDIVLINLSNDKNCLSCLYTNDESLIKFNFVPPAKSMCGETFITHSTVVSMKAAALLIEEMLNPRSDEYNYGVMIYGDKTAIYDENLKGFINTRIKNDLDKYGLYVWGDQEKYNDECK